MITPEINKTDILLVGQSPHKEEVAAGKPFIGPSGKLIEHGLSLAKLKRSQVSITNALLCFENVPLTTAQQKEALACCRPNFLKTLNKTNPKLIVAIGAYALKQVTKLADIAKRRGKILHKMDKEVGKELTVFPIYHPAFILRGRTKGYPNISYEEMNSKEKTFTLDWQEIGNYVANNFETPKIDTTGYRAGTLADLAKINKAKIMSVDFETSSLKIWEPDFRLISVSFSITPGESYVYVYPSSAMVAKIAKVLANNSTKYLANRPFDENVCKRIFGVEMGGRKIDVLTQAHLIDENNYSYGLESVAYIHAKMKDIKELAEDKRHNLESADKDLIIRYNGVDTDSTLRCGLELTNKLTGRLKTYHDKFIQPVMDMFRTLSRNGCLIDTKELKKSEEFALNELDRLHTEALALVPKSIAKLHEGKLSLSRPDFVRDVIFKGLRMKPHKDFITKTGQISVVADHLKMFSHPFITEYSRWKKLEKVYKSYIAGMWGHLYSDGRIYPTMLLTRTTTGRSVILNPPMQTIPQRGEFAPLIKKVFVADKGWLLGARDLAQSELRIMGWLSNCRGILDALYNGIDLHTANAANVARIPIEKVTKQMRQDSKGIGFGLIYGMSAEGLQEYLRDKYNLDWTLERCTKVRDQFFSAYWELPQFYKAVEAQVRQCGYTETILGRKRRVPNIWSDRPGLQNEAIRQAINMHGQSFSSDLAMLGLMLFTQEVERRGLQDSIKPMWFIHDSIIFQAKEKLMPKAMALLKECMEQLSVAYIKEHFGVEVGYPVESDGKVGKSWATLTEIK